MNSIHHSYKVQLINTLPLETISGGNIYNQYLIAGLQKQGITVDYNQRISNYGYNVSIIDSLCMNKIGVTELNTLQKDSIISLIHEVPKLHSESLKVYKQKSFFIVTGGTVKEQLVSEWKINENRIQVIRPGIDSNWKVKKSKANKQKPSILVVANFIPNKGYELLIETLNLLKKGFFELHIVGNNLIDSNYANKVIRTLKNTDHTIYFHFNLNRQEMYQRYLKSDLYLNLSKSETFGMATFEALNLGLECITYKTGDMRYFQQFKNYTIIKEYNSTIFTKQIVCTLNDDLGQKKSIVQNPRTWDHTVCEFSNYLKEVVPC
jgi:glycosyltransferase involved in cell wall biosynthesis